MKLPKYRAALRLSALTFIFILSLCISKLSLAYVLPKIHPAEDFKAFTLYLPGESPLDNGFLNMATKLMPETSALRAKVEVRTGKGGAMAINALYSALPEQYVCSLIKQPDDFLYQHASDPVYSDKDIKRLCYYAAIPLALWVKDDGKITDYSALRTLLQESPPASIYIAGNGSFTAAHMLTEKFNRATGSLCLYFPLISYQEAMKAVLKGTATACWAPALSAQYFPGLRPLAVAFEERAPGLPTLPSFQELGIHIYQTEYLGIAVQATMNKQIQQTVEESLFSLFTSPLFAKSLKEAGFILTPLKKEFLLQTEADMKKEVEEFMESYRLEMN